MNLREQKALQTYENIILTAEQLLKDSSYEELSVDQICECAGISKGGFYHHFPSKDQLLSLLIGRQMGNLIIAHVKPWLNKKDAFELIKICMDTMVEYLAGSPRSTFARCWVALTEHNELTKENFTKDSFQIIHSIITQGKNDGTIRSDLSDDFCFAYINATISGIVLYGLAYKDSASLQKFATDSLKLVCQTLADK